MSEPEDQALDVLKRHNGIIHRQPVFDSTLRVRSYYLSFLDYQGRPLADDDFAEDLVPALPDSLTTLFADTRLILNIPPQWQAAFADAITADNNFILPAGTKLPATDTNVFRQVATASEADCDGDTLLIDFQQIPIAALNQILTQALQRQQTVCALNINSADDYQWCINRHINRISGEFYTHPRLPQAPKTHPSQQMLLQLLVKLHDPDADAESLAHIINQDVTLSYKLLKLVNSAFFGLPREISNTQQAIVMLGQNKIKTWASLLCLSGIDDKPSELRHIAMQRARMCELLARHYKGQPESFFMCGLLSALDALLDKPLAEILTGLPLHPEITTALTDYEGAAGAALRDTIAYERAQWASVTQSSIPMEKLVRIYLESVIWTGELEQQLRD